MWRSAITIKWEVTWVPNTVRGIKDNFDCANRLLFSMLLLLSVLFFLCQELTAKVGTAVAQWLRCCATNQKAAGSIPAGVNRFFIDIKSLYSHYDPGVDPASNRNEYREYFLGVKVAGA